jgi:hypothetical protein
MTSKTFSANLHIAGDNGTWTCFHTPFNTLDVFGKKSRFPVILEVNARTYHTSVFPEQDGTGFVLFNKTMQDETGLKAGDQAEVTLTLDTTPRVVETPPDLQSALQEHPEAAAFWEGLSYSNRKVYINWVDEAKREETRTQRINKTVENLTEGKKLR